MRKIGLTFVPVAASVFFLIAPLMENPAAAADPQFGCTVRQNIETQVVDMNPRYRGTLMEGGVGQRSAAAVRRYMTDKIRPLARVDGRSVVGSQGGASSGGGQ